MVDFRLPSDSELFAAANPNPEAEAARVTATGNPEQMRAIGHRLQRSGVELDAVHRQSQRVQQALGTAFANGGQPVYDEQAHRELVPAGLPDAGTRLHDAGQRVAVLSLELSSARSEVTGSLSRLTTTLDGRRRRFAQLGSGYTGGGRGGLRPRVRLPRNQLFPRRGRAVRRGSRR